jgi:hypothetical protein
MPPRDRRVAGAAGDTMYVSAAAKAKPVCVGRRPRSSAFSLVEVMACQGLLLKASYWRWPDLNMAGIPRDPTCAAALAKRTLTNLYNQRPPGSPTPTAASTKPSSPPTAGPPTSPTNNFLRTFWP